MGKQENIEVFNDTEMHVKTNVKLAEAVKASTRDQKLILEGDALGDVDKKIYDDSAKIIVSPKRTFEAASAYKGQKICVHNFASAKHPGGGVTKGSSAQEEALCRCSTLYFSLNTDKMKKGFYNPHYSLYGTLYNDDIIYTPDVCVFKTDTAAPVMMNEKDWYDVNVITCAAPNLKDTKISDKQLYDLHVKRWRRILDVAAMNKNEVVILGAFGCGAFKNEPKVVAKAAADVLSDYLHCFKTIEFAVFCTPGNPKNYDEFRKALKKFM